MLSSVWSQTKEEIPEIDVPLGEMCRLESEASAESKIPLVDCVTPLPEVDEKFSLDINAILRSPTPTSAENCQHIKQLGLIVGDAPVSFNVQDKEKKPWKIKLYFGNNKTWYGTTTAKIKTSRLDLTIKDLQPYERRSDSFYKVWNNSLKDSLRWIDEPTNTLKITLERKKDEYSLSIFHPKYVFVEGDQELIGHHYNENVMVTGTADGYAVNGRQKLKGQVTEDPYKAFIPGNVYFVSWENSHMLLQPELGYGKKIDLIKAQGKPIVTYTPSISAGVFLGILNSSYRAYDKRWDFDSHHNEKMKVMGLTGSVGNRLTIHNKKDNVGVFVEHKFTYSKMKYDFLDGTAEHDIKMNTLNFGIQFTLIKSK